MFWNGETLQEVVQNDAQADPKSMVLNGETLQEVVQNDAEADPKSMVLNGETLQEVVQNDAEADPKPRSARPGDAGRCVVLDGGPRMHIDSR